MSEKIHDPELTAVATRLATLADMQASRTPWQDDAAGFSTDALLALTHPDLYSSGVPTDVLRATELFGAAGDTDDYDEPAVDDDYYPANTPEEAPEDDAAESVKGEAVVEPVKPKAAKKATGTRKATK